MGFSFPHFTYFLSQYFMPSNTPLLELFKLCLNKLCSFASSTLPQAWLYVWEVRTEETVPGLGGCPLALQQHQSKAEMHRRQWPGSNVYHALWLQYTMSTIYICFFLLLFWSKLCFLFKHGTSSIQSIAVFCPKCSRYTT